MDQGELFSASMKSKGRRFVNSTLEKLVVKQIRDGLNACRIPNYRVKERMPCMKCHLFTSGTSEPGIPDLIGWIPAELISAFRAVGCEFVHKVKFGVPLFIEVKRPKGGVESETQKQFNERAARDGCIVMFATDWSTVAATLRAAGVKIPEGL